MNAARRVNGGVRRLRHLVGLDESNQVEASRSLFHGIRWRLTLWYSAVLAAILLLSSVVLYLGVRQSLLAPINQTLQESAQSDSETWQSVAARLPVVPPGCFLDHGAAHDSLYACYDRHGALLEASPIAGFVPAFTSSSLVAAALSNGQAQDTVDTGDTLGMVERYAVAVPNPNGPGVLGVVQVGVQIGPQLHALDTLLHLLILLGILTIILAAGGGLFLANRALLPARLAYARQRNFIADASHELRTPLTMLRSNVEVVLRGKDRLPPDDVELLEDTVMEAKHLTSLANNMLDLARLDQDGVHLEAEVVDLTQLVTEVARWAEALAAEHDVTIRAEGTGPVLVVADRPLLEQAAMTLIDNAIKYNRPGGEVVVRSWMVDHTAYLEVRDTGIGIEAQHVPRLGERFYRVDKARSRESGGAGLGLSIVHGIAARHGGSFQLSSEPGRGTTATLSLPSAGGTHDFTQTA